jgi:hypothetical protein
MREMPEHGGALQEVRAFGLDVVPGDASYLREPLPLGGGSIEKLATVMGHSSVVVIERCSTTQTARRWK